MKIEQITTGSSLVGVEPTQVVTVVADVPLGEGAVKLVYKTPDVKDRLLNRVDEASKEAGVIESGGGKIRLRKWAEYPSDWDPRNDHRLPVWEALHHLILAPKQGGESVSGALLAGRAAKPKLYANLPIDSTLSANVSPRWKTLATLAPLTNSSPVGAVSSPPQPPPKDPLTGPTRF